LYDFSDIKADRYALSVFPLSTSRGCPYKCGFCYNLYFNKKHWRSMSAKKVFEQVKFVVDKFGAHEFIFEDDDFFINQARVKEFCELVAKEGLKIKWWACVRANEFIKYEKSFVELLKKSGCYMLSIGGESGNPEILKLIDKDNTPDNIVEAVKRCKEFGIEALLSFIVGFPGEKESQMKDTLLFMDRLKKENEDVNFNGVFIFTPFPGTTLYYKCKDEYGVKFPENLEDWARYGFSDRRNISYINFNLLRRMTVINRISRFPVFKRNDDFYFVSYKGRPFLKKATLFLYYNYKMFLLRSGQFRWKHKWFGMAPEWHLWDYWYRRKMPTTI